MADRGFEVVGAAQLRRQLKAAGMSVQDLKDAHREVAERVRTRALQRVPVASGRLRDSIRASGTVSAAIVRAGRASVPYAAPIHWGWPRRHIRANPFILDARDDTQDQWELTYLAALEAVIDKIEGAPGL